VETRVERALGDARRRRRPTADPKITLQVYASIFPEFIAAVVKTSTLKSYARSHPPPRRAGLRPRARFTANDDEVKLQAALSDAKK